MNKLIASLAIALLTTAGSLYAAQTAPIEYTPSTGVVSTPTAAYDFPAGTKINSTAFTSYGVSIIGAASYAAMRALLDLEPGTDYIAAPGSPAQGDVLYYNGSSWVKLAAGTNGYFLQTQGAGANPQWSAAAVAGGGAKTFTFTLPTDPDNDALHFEIEIDNDMDFSSPIISWYTDPAHEGVTGCAIFNGTTWEAYPAGGAGSAYYGERVSFTTSSASLLTGTLYYIRYRVHDGTSFSDWTGDCKTW